MPIDRMTPQQIEQVAPFRREWVELVGGTRPVDRPRAEAAIARIYESAGQPRPAFVWVASPAAGAFAIAWAQSLTGTAAFERRFGAGAGRSLQVPLSHVLLVRGDLNAPTIGDRFARHLGHDLARQLREQISVPVDRAQSLLPQWNQLGATSWTTRGAAPRGPGYERHHLNDESWRPPNDLAAEMADRFGCGEDVGRPRHRAWGDRVGAELSRSWQASNDEDNWDYAAHWLSRIWLEGEEESVIAKYAFARAFLGMDPRGLGAWEEVARACGRWWPLRGICIASERPVAARRDPLGRLHHPSGAALQFGDGFTVHAWHGTQVPVDWITAPYGPHPQIALSAPNVEQRRAAAEIVGWSRVLEHLNVQTIDRDGDPAIGELVEALLPPAQEYAQAWDGDFGPYAQKMPPEAARFLRVRCGTGREFVLSVPREMKTAREANAWTYAMTPDEYQLEVRT